VIKILKSAKHGDLPIEVSRAYVDAQCDYATTVHNGDGILQYDQSFASRRGTKTAFIGPPKPALREALWDH